MKYAYLMMFFDVLTEVMDVPPYDTIIIDLDPFLTHERKSSWHLSQECFWSLTAILYLHISLFKTGPPPLMTRPIKMNTPTLSS
jgi:hypothetical protein